MTNEKTIIKLTNTGKKALEEELLLRVGTKREEIKVHIEDMRSAGDLRENNGYDTALIQQANNEHRISEIENILRTAEIVDESSSTHAVDIGSVVTVESAEREITYSIVGENESDPITSKISYNSPIGSALMAKKVGDEVKVQLPKGEEIYKIIEIR